MTEEEKKAIEKLKETSKQCHNSKECWENEDCCDCYVEIEDILAIDTVVNLIEKQEKVIDEMAKNIENEIGISSKFAFVDLLEFENVEEIKQYFYRKVENNE